MCQRIAFAFAAVVLTLFAYGSSHGQKNGEAAPPPLICTGPKGADDKAVKDAQAAWAKHLNRSIEEEIDLGGGVKMVVVLIPPGTYKMGSPKGELQRRDEEEDQHTVQITQPFYLSKTELTQQQYAKVTGRNPSKFSATNKDAANRDRVKGTDTSSLPVENVSWHNAVECASKVQKLAGNQWATVGLPTEAEWEYACRAGTVTPFHFGGSLNGKEANSCGNQPYGTDVKGPCLDRPAKVGSYPANAFGLVDMHGNVQEWCLDYAGLYSVTGVQRDPVQMVKEQNAGGLLRIVRGGGFGGSSWAARAASRRWLNEDERGDKVGFRLCFRVPGAVPATVAQANPAPAGGTPWRIEALGKNGFSPDTPRDKQGVVRFQGGKPVGIADSKGRITAYSVDTGARMVKEAPTGGRVRLWDRYLWVTIRFEKEAPVDFRQFSVQDEDGRKVGAFVNRFQAALGKPLPEGQYMLVFERDAFPNDMFAQPGDLERKLIPADPVERAAKEWQSFKGLHLSGMNHKAPLEVAKKGPEKK